MAEVLTIKRLRGLKPGEKMIAYVGDFEYDIARCNCMSSSDGGSPKYKQVLIALQDELQRLRTVGVISVNKQERSYQRTNNKGKCSEWHVFVYEVVKLREP